MYSQKIIGFDARPIYRPRDGIGTYTEKTVIAAAKLFANTQFIGVAFKGDDNNDPLITSLPKNVSIIVLPFSWRKYRLYAELGLWRPIDSYINTHLDGFIYFNFVALPFITNTKTRRLVIHDATFLLYPKTMTSRNVHYIKKYTKKSAEQTNTELYTVSKYSARILEEYIHKPFKIAAPGTNDLNIKKLHEVKETGPILFIGTIEPRKNLYNIVKAFNKLGESLKIKHPLIIAGKKGWRSKKIIDYIESSSYITYIESPSDIELNKLYSSAAGFILASTYEGFGIPALDATRYGLPVITSVSSPMAEFLGSNGAIYVDPQNVTSINNGLRIFARMTTHDKRSMIQEATRRSQSYTWESTAKALFTGLAS